MVRPSGPKTRCSGAWTEAKFMSFIKNNLRSATRKWAPIQQCKKRAHIKRGEYKCDSCGEIVNPTYYNEEKRVRTRNVFVDHIDPIVDPNVGFTTWDDIINNMFCELDNLQLLCGKCHEVKSKQEIELAKARRKKEKENV